MLPSFKSILSVALATAMSLLSLIATPFAPSEPSLPTAPDGFTPVLRFVVASDVHINNEAVQAEKDRLAAFINRSYELAENSLTSYKGLDAICFAGDVTNGGRSDEAQYFIDICKANVREGTELLNVMGNHDMFEHDDNVARFEEIFGSDMNYHKTIKGFHFIGVSYNENTSDFLSAQKLFWVNKQLRNAVADGKDKPVFVFQHPHPFATVYGSVNWGNFIPSVLYNQYSQVVCFSGHSHYPINDPRSFWQGTYTSIGTGSLSSFEMEKDCHAGVFPEFSENAAQFRMVEVDANNNVIVRSFDLNTNSFFGMEYYLSDLADKSKFAYTFKHQRELDPAPVFSPDSKVTVSTNEAGETLVTFPTAKDNFIVHSYHISVKNAFGIPVFTDSYMSHYYVNVPHESETCNLGNLNLESGKYIVSVTSQNAYARYSMPLVATFTK